LGGQTGSNEVLLKQSCDAAGRQSGTVPIEKEGRLTVSLRPPQRQIAIDPGHRQRADRAKALSPTLATDADQLGFRFLVADIQSHKLPHTQSAAVKRLEHGSIANPMRMTHGDSVEQLDDLVDPEQSRQALGLFGISQAGSGITRERPLPA
jgi:hypothetical protein